MRKTHETTGYYFNCFLVEDLPHSAFTESTLRVWQMCNADNFSRPIVPNFHKLWCNTVYVTERRKKYPQLLTELFVLSDSANSFESLSTLADLKQRKIPQSLFFDFTEWNGQQNPLTLLSGLSLWKRDGRANLGNSRFWPQCQWQVLRPWITRNCPFKIKEDLDVYLENSGCFLMTSLRVASTAAMVSSDVPTSRCGLPLGNFCTRSRMAYFPASQQVVRKNLSCGLPLSKFCTRSRIVFFPTSQHVVIKI